MPFALLLAGLSLLADGPTDAARKELERLQGTWTMVELEVEGQKIPAEKLEGTTLIIKGDRYTTRVKGTAREVIISLDPSKKPRAIDMHFPDGPELPRVAKGLYEIDGDTLRICRHQMPGQDRPAQFGTWPNTGLFVVVWKRVKP